MARTSKGVQYDAAGDVKSCLFCDILAQRHDRVKGCAPLWYNDGRVAVFVPRTPSAFLHFLVVPLKHIRNGKSLTEEDVPMLLHMQAVALQMLRVHAPLAAPLQPLPRCAPPPAYPYFKDGLDAAFSTPAPAALESRFSLDFHWPPFNSIDHLHLHALASPWRTWHDSWTYGPSMPWCASVDKALAYARAHPSPTNMQGK